MLKDTDQGVTEIDSGIIETVYPPGVFPEGTVGALLSQVAKKTFTDGNLALESRPAIAVLMDLHQNGIDFSPEAEITVETTEDKIGSAKTIRIATVEKSSPYFHRRTNWAGRWTQGISRNKIDRMDGGFDKVVICDPTENWMIAGLKQEICKITVGIGQKPRNSTLVQLIVNTINQPELLDETRGVFENIGRTLDGYFHLNFPEFFLSQPKRTPLTLRGVDINLAEAVRRLIKIPPDTENIKAACLQALDEAVVRTILPEDLTEFPPSGIIPDRLVE